MKTVIITGAGKRIGKEIADWFFSQNWNVVVHYHTYPFCPFKIGDVVKFTPSERTLGWHQDIERFGLKQNETAEIKRIKDYKYLYFENDKGGFHWQEYSQDEKLYIQADLQDMDATRNIVTQAKEYFGRVDCLINNASIFKKDNIQSLTEESLSNHLSVNMIAPLILSQEFASVCEDNSHIINLSDGSEGWSMSENFLSYTLSKMGLENQSALLNKALSPKVKVSCLKLGTVLPRDEKDIKTFQKMHNPDLINSVDELLSAIKINIDN